MLLMERTEAVARYGAPGERAAFGPLWPMPDTVLAALYLEGAPRGVSAPRGRWPLVLGRLRAEAPELGSVVRALRRGGFTEESLALETPRLLDWAERRVRAGIAFTAASPEFPEVWVRRLGAFCPPAFWGRGAVPPGPYLAIVGSRQAPAWALRLARLVGAEAVRLGYSVVSGGAGGCDRAAARAAAVGPASSFGAGSVLEILPCGLDRRSERFPGAALSPFAPEAEFSTAGAMLRNTLIYALSEAAVLAHVRFGQGGTWNGAVAAHRRRLCPLLVAAGCGEAGRALSALGALLLSGPAELSSLLSQAAASMRPETGDLFSPVA